VEYLRSFYQEEQVSLQIKIQYYLHCIDSSKRPWVNELNRIVEHLKQIKMDGIRKGVFVFLLQSLLFFFCWLFERGVLSNSQIRSIIYSNVFISEAKLGKLSLSRFELIYDYVLNQVYSVRAFKQWIGNLFFCLI
jgi:hypothetical protein